MLKKSELRGQVRARLWGTLVWQHSSMVWAESFKGTSRVSAGTWVKGVELINWGAVLSGGNFSTPGVGSRLITSRPGYPYSHLLLQGDFRMLSSWLVIWMLQMKGFGKHISVLLWWVYHVFRVLTVLGLPSGIFVLWWKEEIFWWLVCCFLTLVFWFIISKKKGSCFTVWQKSIVWRMLLRMVVAESCVLVAFIVLKTNMPLLSSCNLLIQLKKQGQLSSLFFPFFL